MPRCHSRPREIGRSRRGSGWLATDPTTAPSGVARYSRGRASSAYSTADRTGAELGTAPGTGEHGDLLSRRISKVRDRGARRQSRECFWNSDTGVEAVNSTNAGNWKRVNAEDRVGQRDVGDKVCTSFETLWKAFRFVGCWSYETTDAGNQLWRLTCTYMRSAFLF